MAKQQGIELSPPDGKLLEDNLIMSWADTLIVTNDLISVSVAEIVGEKDKDIVDLTGVDSLAIEKKLGF